MPSSYAYHREVENTYLVRDRDRQKRRDLLRVILWVLPMAAAVLGYIWLQVQVLDSAYTIVDLEQELTEAGRQRARLALEVSRRSALPTVERRARDELGMVTPTADSTVFWDEVAAGGSGWDDPALGDPAPGDFAPGNRAPDGLAPAAPGEPDAVLTRPPAIDGAVRPAAAIPSEPPPGATLPGYLPPVATPASAPTSAPTSTEVRP